MDNIFIINLNLTLAIWAWWLRFLFDIVINFDTRSANSKFCTLIISFLWNLFVQALSRLLIDLLLSSNKSAYWCTSHPLYFKWINWCNSIITICLHRSGIHVREINFQVWLRNVILRAADFYWILEKKVLLIFVKLNTCCRCMQIHVTI